MLSLTLTILLTALIMFAKNDGAFNCALIIFANSSGDVDVVELTSMDNDQL